MTVRPFNAAEIATILHSAGAKIDPHRELKRADFSDPTTRTVFEGFLNNVYVAALEVMPEMIANVTGMTITEAQGLDLDDGLEIFRSGIYADTTLTNRVSEVMIHLIPAERVD